MGLSALENGVSKPTALTVIWVIFTICVSLTLLRLRINTKRWTNKPLLSDTFLVLGLLWFLFAAIFSTWTLLNRPANHAENIPQVKKYEIVLAAYFYCFIVAIYSIKGSFLAFYWPMFQRRGSASRVTFWAVCFYDAASCVTTILMQTFVCFPFKRFWELQDHCEPYYEKSYFIGVSLLSLTSDLTILFLPLFLLHLLRRVGRTEAIAIAFVILIGFISILASAVRFAGSWLAADSFTVQHVSSTTTVEMLIAVEWGAAYISACLPAFRNWVRRKRGFVPHVGSEEEVNGMAERKRAARAHELVDVSGSLGSSSGMGSEGLTGVWTADSEKELRPVETTTYVGNGLGRRF